MEDHAEDQDVPAAYDELVRSIVEQAPPLTDRNRARLRALFGQTPPGTSGAQNSARR